MQSVPRLAAHRTQSGGGSHEPNVEVSVVTSDQCDPGPRDHGQMAGRGGRTNWITLSTWYFLPQPPGRYTGERVIRSITSQYNYGSLSTSICYLDSVCHTYPLAKTISTIKYHAYNVDTNTRKNINIHFYQHHHHVIYIEQEMMVIFIWDNQLWCVQSRDSGQWAALTQARQRQHTEVRAS